MTSLPWDPPPSTQHLAQLETHGISNIFLAVPVAGLLLRWLPMNVRAALGSDTGGSIRQPAACCGVVGLKPTYGRVSRYGLVAFASSLDQIGPITKTVQDSAILLNVLAGHDPSDSTSTVQPIQDFTKAVKKKDVKKLKLGIPKEFFTEGLDREVEEAVRAAIDEFQNMGGEIKEVSLPSTEWAVATYYVIATAEASSNLARYDGVKFGFRSKETRDLLEMYEKTRAEGFGSEVKRRIMLGTYVLSAGYYDAYYGKGPGGTNTHSSRIRLGVQ